MLPIRAAAAWSSIWPGNSRRNRSPVQHTPSPPGRTILDAFQVTNGKPYADLALNRASRLSRFARFVRVDRHRAQTLVLSRHLRALWFLQFCLLEFEAPS